MIVKINILLLKMNNERKIYVLLSMGRGYKNMQPFDKVKIRFEMVKNAKEESIEM
ncbi:MAG: hypothetical protein ABIN61_09160 [candidate division WOR-3 bacterium]